MPLQTAVCYKLLSIVPFAVVHDAMLQWKLLTLIYTLLTRAFPNVFQVRSARMDSTNSRALLIWMTVPEIDRGA